MMLVTARTRGDCDVMILVKTLTVTVALQCNMHFLNPTNKWVCLDVRQNVGSKRMDRFECGEFVGTCVVSSKVFVDISNGNNFKIAVLKVQSRFVSIVFKRRPICVSKSATHLDIHFVMQSRSIAHNAH